VRSIRRVAGSFLAPLKRVVVSSDRFVTEFLSGGGQPAEQCQWVGL
jgi:hypothetical protein